MPSPCSPTGLANPHPTGRRKAGVPNKFSSERAAAVEREGKRLPPANLLVIAENSMAIVVDHIMMQEDFERLHKFLETDNLPEISSDLRKVIEEEWPELVYKLPPKE